MFPCPKGPKLSHLANANPNPSTNDDAFQRMHSSEHVRKFEGDFARALSRPKSLSSGGCVQELAAMNADLSRWHLDLVVNKLQGLHYIQHRLVITSEVIAMGCISTSNG